MVKNLPLDKILTVDIDEYLSEGKNEYTINYLRSQDFRIEGLNFAGICNNPAEIYIELKNKIPEDTAFVFDFRPSISFNNLNNNYGYVVSGMIARITEEEKKSAIKEAKRPWFT